MRMLVPREETFCYDGSLEGFLCAVFDAYALRCRPRRICPADQVQLALGQEVRDVATDLAHAERVRAGLVRRGGRRAFDQAELAFLSDAEGREGALLAFVEKVMDEGKGALSDLADPCVARVGALATEVLNEREHMYQFLRFEELEGGIYYARINPRCRVLPLLMGHFVERFNTQPFIIYDEVHRLAGAYDLKGTCLVRVDGLEVPERTACEREFQQLWKRFYDSVSNEQRFNPDLRRSFVPQRLWRNLTEFRALLDS